MKLKKITISNFHCYQNAAFDFGDELTILIGKNGSGKSSLIKAIRNALSIFFSKNPSWGYPSIVKNVSDLGVSNLASREIWHDQKMTPADEVDVCMETTYNPDNEEKEEDFPAWSFHKRSTAKAKLQTTYYKTAYVKFCQHYTDEKAWPLFAYYSDRYPHIGTKLSNSVKKMINNDDRLYRGWGYFHWDYDTSCALVWQMRYMRIYNLHYKRLMRLQKIEDKNSKEARTCVEELNRYWDEINFVLKYVKLFTSTSNPDLSDPSESLEVTDIIVDGGDNDSYLVAYFSDGNRRRWDELPAGYERLYNIVFDIAYRSYILNGNVEPQGIVMIDEIDLHLHPSMEQDVLQRLIATFPKIQFVVTTHSPLVIGNTSIGEKGKVILLGYEGENYDGQTITDPFGLDYDFILSAVMNTEPRNIKLQMLKDKYLRLMRREKTELAKETLASIKDVVKSGNRFSEIVDELKLKLEEN